MKKFSSFLMPLLIFAVINLYLRTGIIVAQENNICTVDLREYPGRDPVMWDGLYAASDGKVYSALINEGESAHFYVYDPKADKNILICDMAEFLDERGKGIRSTGKIHNKPVEDNEGNIYFVSMNKNTMLVVQDRFLAYHCQNTPKKSFQEILSI